MFPEHSWDCGTFQERSRSVPILVFFWPQRSVLFYHHFIMISLLFSYYYFIIMILLLLSFSWLFLLLVQEVQYSYLEPQLCLALFPQMSTSEVAADGALWAEMDRYHTNETNSSLTLHCAALILHYVALIYRSTFTHLSTCIWSMWHSFALCNGRLTTTWGNHVGQRRRVSISSLAHTK